MTKFVVFCANQAGVDAINIVLHNGHQVDIVIGLDDQFYNNETASGLIDIASFSTAHNIEYHKATSYNLTAQADIDFLSSLDIELIWVAGWQRLLPEWLLAQSKNGALGGHGSPEGITSGRGRSPQNWALLTGADKFSIALFKLTPGIDDGPVIEEQEFKYNVFDDIQTSYKKVSICMGSMVSKYLNDKSTDRQAYSQHSEPKYYPQRMVEDGFIDWHAGSTEVYNFVRALSKPYPMARSTQGNDTIKFNRVRPFDEELGAYGEISFIFNDGTFLVNTLDGRVLIDDFEAPPHWNPVLNSRLDSVPKVKNLQKVFARHINKFPDLKISDNLEKFMKQ